MILLTPLKFSALAFLLGIGLGCSPLAKKADPNSPETQVTDPNTRTAENRSVEGECPLEFKKLDLCASFESNKGQVKMANSSFDLKFWRKEMGNRPSGPFIDPGYTVCVKPWMKMSNGHQHGSFDTDQIRIDFDDVHGTFEVLPIFFTMSGKWEVYVQLCEGEVNCDAFGYNGCPGGKFFDQAVTSVQVHE